jgi:hypothetical protein
METKANRFAFNLPKFVKKTKFIKRYKYLIFKFVVLFGLLKRFNHINFIVLI